MSSPEESGCGGIVVVVQRYDVVRPREVTAGIYRAIVGKKTNDTQRQAQSLLRGHCVALLLAVPLSMTLFVLLSSEKGLEEPRGKRARCAESANWRVSACFGRVLRLTLPHYHIHDLNRDHYLQRLSQLSASSGDEYKLSDRTGAVLQA